MFMRSGSSKSLFGIVCLSLAMAFLFYWITYMTVLPRLMRPQASTALPFLSSVVGASSCALLYLGLYSIVTLAKSKPKDTIVLGRSGKGRVFSFGWTEPRARTLYVLRRAQGPNVESPEKVSQPKKNEAGARALFINALRMRRQKKVNVDD